MCIFLNSLLSSHLSFRALFQAGDRVGCSGCRNSGHPRFAGHQNVENLQLNGELASHKFGNHVELHLIAMASNLIAMASNLLAMASNLIAIEVP